MKKRFLAYGGGSLAYRSEGGGLEPLREEKRKRVRLY